MLRIAGTDGFGWDLLKIFVNSFYNRRLSGYFSTKTFFILSRVYSKSRISYDRATAL